MESQLPDLQFLIPHIGPAAMVLARLTGIFLYAPVLSSPFIPRIVRAYLVISLTLALYPSILVHLKQNGWETVDLSLWSMVPILGLELLVGFVIGFLAMLPLAGVQLAGHKMGQQFGLAVAQEADPNLNSSSSAVGIILFYMALLSFIHMGGISVLFSAMINTFEQVPIGGMNVDLDLLSIVVGVLQSSFELAVRVATPIFCMMFLQTIALGFISRTAPAFNILSLGFPMRVILGICVMIASIEFVNEAILDELYQTLNGLFDVFSPN